MKGTCRLKSGGTVYIRSINLPLGYFVVSNEENLNGAFSVKVDDIIPDSIKFEGK